jgi:hypothetical protein
MPVVVEGVPELKKALKKFAPDLRKQMDDEIRVALKEVTNAAKAKVPGQAPGGLYNWQDTGIAPKSRTSRAGGFPKYNARVIRRGLTYSLGRSKRNMSGFASLYSLLNKSASGSIAETAGRASGISGSSRSQSNNPQAGSRFIGGMNGIGPMKSLDGRQKSTGRILFAAYAENEGKALDGVMRAIDKASRLFKERARVRKAA